jgi:hypothetical protein
VEALGILGVGWVQQEQQGSAGAFAQNSSRGGGWYWNTGLRGGAYMNWRRLVIGANVELLYVDLRTTGNWDDAKLTTEGQTFGVGGGIEIGYQLQ